MSKLSFRARALDPCKPMPIYLAEELPDLPEYSAINRAVPQMPSGMEKEEESEHHLQRAICTGLIIPTPEVFATDVDFYEKNYPANYKMPRQLIHMQPLGLEQDIPDYDMDSADELWMNSQARRLDLTPLKFEQMMDKLEKSSGQTVVTLNEAKALLKQDDEVSTAVYDYWLNKRLKTQHPLILSVKTENRSGTAANNPYLAFRRRTEKMQTRKNRKNDETSYEKMLKLRRDLSRAVTLLEMVKKREKNKREQLHLSIEVFEKRYQLRDFNGSIMSELSSSVKSSRPAFAPIYTNQYSHHSSSTQVGSLIASSGSSQQPPQHHHYSSSSYHASGIGVSGSSTSAATKRDLDASSRKEKRQYKKRKHKLQRDRQYTVPNVVSPAAIESTISSEDEDLGGSHLVGSEGEDEGLYAFRRKQSCEYHRPLTKDYGNWPWESKENNGQGDPRFRFTLTSIKHPRPRCIGFARRRVGRGGRVILDRIATNGDDLWSQLDYTILDNRAARKAAQTEGADNEKIESTCLSDDETSRDSKYVSSAFDPVTSTYDSMKCIKKESDSMYSGYSDVVSYSNSYSNLCSRLICDTEVSYTSSEKEKETGGISDLLNKKIKQEISEDAYVGGDDWAQLIKEGNRSPSLLEQQDSGIVVDLVRTQCLNRISNRNISGNNNNNNLTTGYNTSFSGSGDLNATSRTLLNKRHSSETSIANVIKDEILTVIKRECETDTNNSDDDNVDLASLSNILHASRGTAVASVSGMSAASDMKFDDYLGSDRSLKYEEPLTHSNFVDLNTNTKLLQSSEFWGAEPKVDLDVLTAGRSTANFEEGDNDKEVIYKEFLEEINKDWLHFYPKTPSPCANENIFEDNTKPFVDFSEQTPITIELQRVDKCATPPQPCTPPSSVFTSKIESDPSFVTMAFSYNDLAGDEQSLLLNATTDSSNSGIDFNLSGDSLAELNLSLGEDENEKMLENILEECQIDDLKTLNQTTTFWDGILEDGGLLDVIEEKKGAAVDAEKAADVLVNGAENTMINAKEETKRYPMKRKASVAKLKVGSSYFAVKNASKDEKFFCKEEPQSTNPQQSMICEPPEELLEVPHTAQQGAAENSVPNSRLAVRISGSNSSQVSTSTNVLSQISGTNNMPIKVLIKPETPAGNVSAVSTPIVTTINQVPINQMNASQVMATIPSNVKLGISNMIRITGTTTSLSDAIGSIGTSSVSNASSNMSNTVTVPSLLMTSIQPHQQTSQHQLSTQQPQQHIILRQITQSSQTQQQLIQNSSGTASTSAANYTTDGSGAIVIATNKTSPTKRQTNGPTDKNALQHILKQRCPNRRFNLLKQTYVDEDYIVQTTQKSQQTQAQQHLQTSSGNIIKIPQLPVIVPELNFQQQQQQGQQQSQQQNTVSASAAVAVASNHNYSLQPTAQPIAIIGQQSSGNKIILNTSGAGGTVVGGANFTIATPISDLSAKIQYESIPTSNIKVNLVTSSGIQQGSLIMDAKNSQMVKNSLQQHQQAQITVATGHQQAQTQLHQARKTVNMFIDPDQKRVLCKLVNLHNLSPLQTKNSAGQTVQVSSGAAAHLLNKAHTVQRLGNSAIVANVRALAVNNQVIGTTTNAGVNATASLNSIVAGVASTAQSGSSAASGADVSATHKTQSTNSSGTNNNSSGSDTTANVVSSGINLNTTNR